jgi:SAM-dependent methyltransferase
MSKPGSFDESHAGEEQDSHAGAQHFCDFVRPLVDSEIRQRVLVAGCGNGHEALHIRQNLDAIVTGVDIDQQWNPGFGVGVPDFALRTESILDLPFADGSFDLVFYHHVIEHVSDPAGSVEELARVLVPGGIIYIGTPNRHRAVGYLGSVASPRDKLKWNVADYKARLRRRFRNEYGAHAGFTERELLGLMRPHFTDIHFLTDQYIRYKYGRRLPAPVLTTVCTKPFMEVAAAAVYAVGRKPFATR